MFHFQVNSNSLRAGSLVQVQGKFFAAESPSREEKGSAAKIIFPRNSHKGARLLARTAVTNNAFEICRYDNTRHY